MTNESVQTSKRIQQYTCIGVNVFDIKVERLMASTEHEPMTGCLGAEPTAGSTG